MRPWKVYLIALVVGLVGVLIALVAKDLWTDHAQHHAIWELELRRAQAQQAQSPAPPPK